MTINVQGLLVLVLTVLLQCGIAPASGKAKGVQLACLLLGQVEFVIVAVQHGLPWACACCYFQTVLLAVIGSRD